MRIKINKETLTKSLARVHAVVERRNVMPILSHVKIEWSGGRVRFSTTDADILVSDLVSEVEDLDKEKSNISNGYSFTTAIFPLYEMIRKLYECDDVVLSISAQNSSMLTVNAGKSIFQFPVLSADEFPDFSIVSGDAQFDIDSKSLSFLFNQVKHAAACGEARYFLNGVYFHTIKEKGKEGVKLCTVATDSHRMAKAESALFYPEEKQHQLQGVIIPRKTVVEVSRLLDEFDHDVQVGLSANRVMFTIGNTKIISKIIDATFPDYKAIFNSLTNDVILKVHTKELAKSIDLVSTITEGKTRSVKLSLKGDKITVSVDGAITGGASGTQEVKATSNNPKKERDLLVNSRYILDSLSCINGETTEITIGGSDAGPIVLRDYDNALGVHILMPMQPVE